MKITFIKLAYVTPEIEGQSVLSDSRICEGSVSGQSTIEDVSIIDFGEI